MPLQTQGLGHAENMSTPSAPSREVVRIKKIVPPTFIYLFGALGGILFGFDTGVISGALLFIQEDIPLTSFGQGAVVSGVLLGAMIGGLGVSSLADRYGRKRMIILASLIFVLGAAGCAVSTSMWLLIGARVVLGIAVGAASALVPMYLSEVAPAERRGSISGLNQLMIMIGILSAYLINLAFSGAAHGWRLMLGFAVVPALLMLLGGLFLPESPRYLATVGREGEARVVLTALRGKGNPQVVEAELEDIKSASDTPKGSFKDIFAPWIRPALVGGLGLAILVQFVGCNTVIYYAPTTFTRIGMGKSAALLSTVGIGALEVIVTAIAVSVMDRFKRRSLLTFGAAGMAISLTVLGLVHLVGAEGSTLLSVVTVAFTTIYIMFFASTWGPITWITIGEVFPLSVRGQAVGFCTSMDWLANLVVALTFPVLLAHMGTSVFLIYAAVCFFSLWFVNAKMFETRGRSLEDIEDSLRNSWKAKQAH